MKLGKSQREKETKRVASVAAYNAEGLLLFGKRSDNGKWTMPGGHLEPSEEPMDAARRELEEEADLQGQDFQYLGRGLGGLKDNIIVYCYKCVVDGTPDGAGDPDEECEEWRWVEPDDIPKEILENLHSPKNITLRLLGLQEGEVEEPMEKKADPHFVERNPYSGSPIRIPKLGTRSRKKWDQEYHGSLVSSFAGGDASRLRPIQVPTEHNMGSNMAVNKSRLALYKRMLKAGDRLPPVVVKRVGTGFHLLDGNHRLEAARQAGIPLLHAVELLDPPLKKGLPGLALMGALAMGASKPTPQVPQPEPRPIHQMAQQVGIPKWSPEGLDPDMFPIAHLESAWGKLMSHHSHSKGVFHTAVGALGFKPITGHEEYTKSKVMQAKYPGLHNPEDFMKVFTADPKFYNLLASAHFHRLKHRHGDTQKAAFAWRWGTGAASAAAPDKIKNDLYVQKYTHMNLDRKTGQPVIAPKPVPLGKSIPDKLVEQIKPHLTDDLRRAPWKGSANCLAGHCYVASEALWHLLGGQASGYVPQSIQHEGGPHWYLKHKETGRVLDPTASQFNTPVPYNKGVGKGFLTKQPSKRAQVVIDSVRTRKLKKAEELEKMAITTLPIAPKTKDSWGQVGYDYSHLLSPEHKAAGYNLIVYGNPHDEEGEVHLKNLKNPHLNGSLFGKLVFSHQKPVKRLHVHYSKIYDSISRGKGFGIALYEAALQHGKQVMGADKVAGDEHSTSASKTHARLAAKHGMDYTAVPNPNADESEPPGPFDAKYAPYEYTIKEELDAEDLDKHEVHDPLEAMLQHDDPRERILALKSKAVTPYHLRLALQDEDPDVRNAAVKHPMMTSNLVEEALKHPDLSTKEAVLSRPDLQEYHLEQAIWDPDLQTQAARHPGLTEEQRKKLAGAINTPEGLRSELLAKSIGYLLYPKLEQAKPPTEPMIRNPEAHQKYASTVLGDRPKNYGLVHANSYRNQEIPPEKRFLRASVSMKPNASVGNLRHETQHGVFAALRQKYGREASARIVATTLSALDPKDHQHLKNITDWAVQNKYDPIKEPEERIAYLQNYLQDGLWRKSAHKHMRIHMNPEAEQVAQTWAKAIWQKLRNRARGLGPEHVGVVRKSDDIKGWVAKKSEEDYSPFEDMLGLTPKTDTYLKAAKFLAHTNPDLALFRQCLRSDMDLVDAALHSVGLDVNIDNRKSLISVLKIQDMNKSETDYKTAKDIRALMPDGNEVAEGVRRGFGSNTEEELHLGGKHSAGSMMVQDPEKGQIYLLKPGSNGQSPAKGAREERANQSRREAAFWHVAEAWGLNQRVPRADLLLIDGKEVAALHMLPFDWKNLEKLKFQDAGLPHKALEKYRQNGELHKWAVMDFVLGNPDRHGQNIMVGPQKEDYPVALIDHGSAFAGSHFDPAHDKNSFIPYYLRAWHIESWQNLNEAERLRAMPTVSGDTEKQLRDWFHGINTEDLEAILHRFGIDPAPTSKRLAIVKALLAEPNFSEAINRLWIEA